MLAVAMFALPFVAYRNPPPPFLGSWSGEITMWIQISLILIVKTVATVGGRTSAGSLRALNELAQTLSAAGRAMGPVAAGGLFSVASGKGRMGG